MVLVNLFVEFINKTLYHNYVHTEGKWYMQSVAGSMVLGIHWWSWKASPVDKRSY